jgi:hypothetical protein
VDSAPWIYYCRRVGLIATFVFTLVSGLHYIYVTGQRLLAYERAGKPAASAQ